jgi:speckle-type POZ protein
LKQASRSPVFRAMLENEMKESCSGIIKIYDVSYDVLRAFVHYMYTAEVLLDEQMASDLLVLAEKYEVKHLKAYCEKLITSKVNNDNAISHYAFAHRHSAKQLLETSLLVLMDNMSTLADREEYKELVEKDPRLVVEIYEAYLNRQVNTAAGKDIDCSRK